MLNTRQKRENEIINAAKKVFIEKGYNQATMEDIINETDLSKGGVYHYFKNKEDICIHLMGEAASTEMNLEEKLTISSDNVLENICEYFFNILVTHNDDVKLASILLIDTRNDVKIQKRIHETFIGEDIKKLSEFVYKHQKIINKDLFQQKLKFFMVIFHSLLYYKYIEETDYLQYENDVKELFLNIFQDVICE